MFVRSAVQFPSCFEEVFRVSSEMVCNHLHWEIVRTLEECCSVRQRLGRDQLARWFGLGA